jgi:hypothetical protein
MAIVSLRHPFDAFHGKTTLPGSNSGLVTFQSLRGTHISRQFVIPSNPKSVQQQMIRGHFSAAAAGYKLLTAAQAAAWTALGHTLSKTNMLDTNYTMSGIAAYQLVNVYRLLHNQAQTVTAPALSTMPVPVTGITSCVYTSGSSTLVTIADCTGMANGALVLMRLSSSIARQSRLFRENELRLGSLTETTCFGVVAANAVTITTVLSQVAVTATQYIGLSLTPMSATYMPRLTPYFLPQQLVAAP